MSKINEETKLLQTNELEKYCSDKLVKSLKEILHDLIDLEKRISTLEKKVESYDYGERKFKN